MTSIEEPSNKVQNTESSRNRGLGLALRHDVK